MFSIVALPYQTLQSLPPLEFKLMAALLRYVDKAGGCRPALRQLAVDIGKSEATVCRTMKRLAEEHGVFAERRRPGNGRYFYRIAERFLPRWPGKRPAEDPSCTTTQDGLAQPARQEANPIKQARGAHPRGRFAKSGIAEGYLPDPADRWQARVRSWVRSGGKFWLADWGPRPNEVGCWAPPGLLAG